MNLNKANVAYPSFDEEQISDLLYKIGGKPIDLESLIRTLLALDLINQTAARHLFFCVEVMAEKKNGRTKTNAIMTVSARYNFSETQLWKAMNKYEAIIDKWQK